ncbi:MAG TPA: hypothetical protein VM925_27855 [Labilithrix sp.]|nr:hypothetical protein [Labilithrix sp.]
MHPLYPGLPVILFVSTVSLAASAERPTARLAYTSESAAVPGCPDERAMHDLVASHLGYDPFVTTAERSITISIRRDHGKLRGGISLTDEDGRTAKERVFTESRNHCHELASTLALSASMLVDPAAAGPGSAAPVAPPASEILPPPAPPPPVDAHDNPFEPAPAQVTPPPAPNRVAARLGAELLATALAEPEPSVGGAVFVGLGSRTLSLDLEGRVDLPREREVSGLSAQASVLAATLAPCVHLSHAVACLLGTAGALQGVLNTRPNAQHQTSFYAAGGGRIGGEFPLSSRVGLRVHADALATITRTHRSRPRPLPAH